MAHLGHSAHCAGSARRPRKAIEISTVNLHYWLPISLLLWKPIIGHCRITEQFMEVFRVYKPQWELPLTGVFHQPRSAYLFTQWVKSIRNLNKSLLKYHEDSHSRNASNSFQLLSLSSHPCHGCIQSTGGPPFLYFILFSCTYIEIDCSFEDTEAKSERILLCLTQSHQTSSAKLDPTPTDCTLSHQGNRHLC